MPGNDDVWSQSPRRSSRRMLVTSLPLARTRAIACAIG
jgi:hypothetical protein